MMPEILNLRRKPTTSCFLEQVFYASKQIDPRASHERSTTVKTPQSELASSYDRVAQEYAREFALELDKKPFDRKILELLIEKVGNLGTICDMGCGPGQIAGYLHQMRAGVCGVDLSAEMIHEARRLNPAVPFHQGDMLDLKDVPDDSFGGIAAFYSIIHIPL
jgi:2-polyprenyl-3-methyl-5-hydroxy-6-metoxy-1,4-benzoquinol methylase